MSTLITPVELAQWQSDGESLFIFDCRSSLMDETAGKRAYDDAHIPGAQFAHLSDDLSGPITPGVTGRHPLPEKDAFKGVVTDWTRIKGSEKFVTLIQKLKKEYKKKPSEEGFFILSNL